MKNEVRPIDANALAKRIREYMDNFPYAGTRLATCRVVLSMLGDEGQTPTLTDHFPDLTKMLPLTLEQLREMGGQPVWVKVIGKTGISCDGWCEVEIRDKDPFAYVLWPGSEVEDIAKIEDYGKTWSCYAYPPAHIDREAWEPCGAYVPKIVTNADRIRAMSDEELAEWMCSLMTAECCDQRCPARDICNLGDNGLVKWMKQPAEED